MRNKDRRSFHALIRQRERVVSRSRGPKRESGKIFPFISKSVTTPRPVEVLDPMEEFSKDVTMDAIHEIAQAEAQRNPG